MPQYHDNGEYLLVEFTEPYSLSNVIAVIHEVAPRCQQAGRHKVLVDLRRSEGNPNMLDRFKFGIEIARVWGSRIKAAVVANPGIINRMGETVAVNRGGRVRVTHDIAGALEWLGVN